jgi:hypothetical protein
LALPLDDELLILSLGEEGEGATTADMRAMAAEAAEKGMVLQHKRS